MVKRCHAERGRFHRLPGSSVLYFVIRLSFSYDLFFQCKRKHYLLLLVLFLIASRRAWHERTSLTFSGRRLFHSRHSTFHYRFCHYRRIFSDATHNLCLAAISNTYFHRMGGKGIVIQLSTLYDCSGNRLSYDLPLCLCWE